MFGVSFNPHNHFLKTFYRHKFENEIIVSLSLTMTVLPSQRIRGSLCVFVLFFPFRTLRRSTEHHSGMSTWQLDHVPPPFVARASIQLISSPAGYVLSRLGAGRIRRSLLQTQRKGWIALPILINVHSNPPPTTIYISLNQGGSVNHHVLKENKALSYVYLMWSHCHEAVRTMCSCNIRNYHFYFWTWLK